MHTQGNAELWFDLIWFCLEMGLPCDKVGQGSRDNTQLSSFTKDKR